MTMSMTGFGQGIVEGKEFTLVVDIKSVNSRYLDINIKMPKKFNKFEEDIRTMVKANLTRGKVDLYFNVMMQEREDILVKPDMPLLRKYKAAYEEIITDLSLSSRVELSHLLRVQDALIIEDKDLDEERTKDQLTKAVEEALGNLKEMRLREGRQLINDIGGRIDYLERVLETIKEKAPQFVIDHKEKMVDRIKELLADVENFNQERLDMEVAVFADKKDISEEIVRLASHFGQIRDLLGSPEPVGRKLDFLIQEMNREINTIGSKSPDVDLSNAVIDMKSELEKIREQVQNIE